MQCVSKADRHRAAREHRHRWYGWSGSLLHGPAADHSLGRTSLKASRDNGDIVRRVLEDLAKKPTQRAGAQAEPGFGVSSTRSCPAAVSHEVPEDRSHSIRSPHSKKSHAQRHPETVNNAKAGLVLAGFYEHTLC